MRSLRISIITSWLMLSKKLFMSPSMNHFVPLKLFCRLFSAVWQLLCGLKPCEVHSKYPSYMASSTILTTSCTNLSANVGIPSGRNFPLFFGI